MKNNIIYISVLMLSFLPNLKIFAQDELQENFLEFFEMFSVDTEFQISRVRFPFEDCYYIRAGIYNDSIIEKCDLIAKDKWMFINFKEGECDSNNIIKLIYTSFETDEKETGERVLEYVIPGTDVAILYYFKLIENRWYLIKRKDFSY